MEPYTAPPTVEEKREARREAAKEQRNDEEVRKSQRAQRHKDARLAERADRNIEATQSAYLKLDDLAIHLDDAIGALIDDPSGGRSRVDRIRAQIAAIVAAGSAPDGSNQLLGAAGGALTSAASGDVQGMIRARLDAGDSRSTMAGAVIG